MVSLGVSPPKSPAVLHTPGSYESDAQSLVLQFILQD
jgi:hypothetical protein